jgi:pimeloyl-ACP methyl ester carboxylesterase
MAEHIDGPLYYETMGESGPVMAFVHPNPMDQSCWIFQMAQMSTWYRCIAIDLPGYGKSPKARAGLTMQDIAQACWEAIDDAHPGERAILVGCSIGPIDADLDAQPPPAANRGADHVRHRLQPQEGVHPTAHRGL